MTDKLVEIGYRVAGDINERHMVAYFLKNGMPNSAETIKNTFKAFRELQSAYHVSQERVRELESAMMAGDDNTHELIQAGEMADARIEALENCLRDTPSHESDYDHVMRTGKHRPIKNQSVYEWRLRRNALLNPQEGHTDATPNAD